MEQRFLTDTNSIIDAQMNRLPENGRAFLANVINKDFTVSFITYIEFLGYKDITRASEELIALASVIEIDKTIIDICIALRKAHKIKLPDAIIAATALAYDFTFVSNNEKDFTNIEGLKFINPHKM